MRTKDLLALTASLLIAACHESRSRPPQPATRSATASSPTTSSATPSSAASAAPQPDSNASEVSVAFVRQRGGKPPLRFNFFKLTVVNHRAAPTWFITRYYGETPLASDEPFQMEQPWEHGVIDVHAFDGGKNGGTGQAFVVSVIGRTLPEPGHSFVAFLLPAHGSLAIDEFEQESWKDYDAFEVWETESLKVNGTPLEDWLPYRVLGSIEARIPAGTDWFEKHSAFEWKPGKSKETWPTERVTSIVPAGVKKHSVPISMAKKDAR